MKSRKGSDNTRFEKLMERFDFDDKNFQILDKKSKLSSLNNNNYDTIKSTNF